MTVEELFKKNFPEYVTEKGACLSPYFDLFESGYELSEKRIKELEAQIEKMKCCGICQHHYFDNYDVISCAEEKDVTNKKCKFWELSIERR